jgi:transposase-like protein
MPCLMPGQEGDLYRRIEVITGQSRRRRWTAEEKARIVEESFETDANISEVARRNGVARGCSRPGGTDLQRQHAARCQASCRSRLMLRRARSDAAPGGKRVSDWLRIGSTEEAASVAGRRGG